MVAISTPPHQDKHLFATAAYVLIATFNHRLSLNLSPTELIVLASVLGVYIGQSQLTMLAKLKAVISAAPSEEKDDGPTQH